MLSTPARVAALERQIHDLTRYMAELREKADQRAPAVLAAELADIRQALDVDRAALRKSLGKIWGTIGGADRKNGHVSDEQIGSELQSMLELQHWSHG